MCHALWMRVWQSFMGHSGSGSSRLLAYSSWEKMRHEADLCEFKVSQDCIVRPLVKEREEEKQKWGCGLPCICTIEWITQGLRRSITMDLRAPTSTQEATYVHSGCWGKKRHRSTWLTPVCISITLVEYSFQRTVEHRWWLSDTSSTKQDFTPHFPSVPGISGGLAVWLCQWRGMFPTLLSQLLVRWRL